MSEKGGASRGFGKYRKWGVDREIIKGMHPEVPLLEGMDGGGIGRMSKRLHEAALIPLVGVTTDGTPLKGLFPLKRTGVPTTGMVEAARAFVATLAPEPRERVQFPIDAPQWREWFNSRIPPWSAHGQHLLHLSTEQRAAFENLMRACLSDHGFRLMRNIMKLNHHLGEIIGDMGLMNEWQYWFSLFGNPSSDEPWGWQVDGHHLNLNFFVLGDQVVLSPTFIGSEPREADEGVYKGIYVFKEEEERGLRLMQGLRPDQQQKALRFPSIMHKDLPEQFTGHEGRNRGGASRDNITVPYEGIRADALSGDQQKLLLKLVEAYSQRLHSGHDRVLMDDVKAHLNETHFAWGGKWEEDSVFYYKVHSPVIWIEFDHRNGVLLDNSDAEKIHIHTIVRTPNGNDYGRDLLREHLEKHHRAPAS